MKKILKFLKCETVEEVAFKMKSGEYFEEIEEFSILMSIISRGKIERKDVTSVRSKSDLLAYLRSAIGFKINEEFRVLFLNTANRLIADEVLFTGTIDRSTIYPRVVIQKALKHNARGIILVHNHPSGELEPSRKDKELTIELKEILDNLDVKVLDHIIMSETDYYSFYEKGLIY